MDPLKTSAPPEAKLHFLDYWRIIRIRKTVILAVFLLVVITATIVTFILPEQFSSTARIKVEGDTTDVPGITQTPNYSGHYDPYFIQTEFEVIQSEVILDRVIEGLNLNEAWKQYNNGQKLKTSQSRAQLKRMMELHPDRNTSLIEIKIYSNDKKEAAAIANEVAIVYQKYRLDQKLDITGAGIKVFKQQVQEQDDLIAKQEAKVDKLRKDLKVTDLGGESATGPQQTLEPMNVMHYNTLRIDAETQYIKEEKLLSQLKQLKSDELKQAIPTAAPDAILIQLLQDLIGAETKLVTLLADYGDKHPEVLRTQKLVNELNAKIDDRVKGIMVGMDARVASLLAVVKNSEDKVNEAKSNDLVLAESSRPYFIEKSQLDHLKKFREILEFRAAQEQVDRALPKTTMVQIVDTAEEIDKPVRPNKALNIALGIIIGLVVGVGLAFFIEYLDTSVKTIDDVERTLQAPVLGVIPQNVGLLLDEGAESPHAEAYRVLRTNLMFSRKDDKLNTMAVVSAGAGEGKSTTVYNMATVFAQSGHRVVMVDSDLRRPTLHKLVNVSNTIGLTNYLLKQNTLEEVIQTTRLPNLDFMASGKLPSSSLGILSSAQMKDLITELKQRYDYVFFDSPPIMGVSDASILASEVDMTLQVIQYRRYPQPMNIRAKQLIEKVGGNLIGIVLNNINMSQDESYYYYSGYYHDYYSKNEDESETATDAGEGKARTDIKPKY
ncbi:GumC family protein [Pedosphaera parvula]|uniref:Capsular exopolysaccharide family n=1 Tax=Pedosphaera parvula (strain Ellin514) TaxID=320771 RepID=B9XK55_PEDPL|nr:polysaccharide biosynthesis tyrosine autokinase [Pedosphaera parvula]EEF59878.1 capsular exopolysaccharide family [Pedosphaera parvula Ellin514]